jgi:hypothetical protein
MSSFVSEVIARGKRVDAKNVHLEAENIRLVAIITEAIAVAEAEIGQANWYVSDFAEDVLDILAKATINENGARK